MQDFIGTKPLKAESMTRGDYNAHRGWTPPEGEDQSVAGYHVVYADGYQSWSPAPQFEEAYQPLDAMSFGHAIVMLKAGRRVARAGWNGKGMWIAYTPPSVIDRAHVKPGHALSAIADELPFARVFPITGHIDMRAADGSLVVGWVASQTDMLAGDWGVVE